MALSCTCLPVCKKTTVVAFQDVVHQIRPSGEGGSEKTGGVWWIVFRFFRVDGKDRFKFNTWEWRYLLWLSGKFGIALHLEGIWKLQMRFADTYWRWDGLSSIDCRTLIKAGFLGPKILPSKYLPKICHSPRFSILEDWVSWWKYPVDMDETTYPVIRGFYRAMIKIPIHQPSNSWNVTRASLRCSLGENGLFFAYHNPTFTANTKPHSECGMKFQKGLVKVISPKIFQDLHPRKLTCFP